jgi:hypothetical protein
MAYAVQYYRPGLSGGVVTIESDAPFETAEWAVETFDDDDPRGVPLPFAGRQSGTGVLSNGGLTITITIPACPVDDFRLTVGSFRKILNLTEGDENLESQIVAASDVSWSSNFGLLQGSASYGIPMALVWFNSKKTPSTIGQNHTAKLYQGNVLRCHVFGTAFVSTYSTNDGWWPYSGILFYKFGWVGAAPETPENFTMLLDAGSRGSGAGRQQLEVTVSGTEAVGPTSEVYSPLSGYTFVLDDGYLL